MRYFIKLAYNGAPFFGWQIQPKQISVQEVIENAFSLLLKEKIRITGCGRTDTGVNAREYFAHFDYGKKMSAVEIDRLIGRLNNFLPKEIVIYHIYLMPDKAHARFDAISRTYRYYINLGKNPFSYSFALQLAGRPDIEKMNQAASILLEIKDFTSFSKLHTQVNNNICHLTAAFWKIEKEQLIFEITADRFLRNMVRAIVGTLLWVGKGKLSIGEFQDIINQKNRCKAGNSVPANALFLEKVRYPKEYMPE
jgi:tRNA pseudouridine38-40 synthase